MKLADAYANAKNMSASDRWAAYVECQNSGQHQTIRVNDTNPPNVYDVCPKCWTLFRDGIVQNPPQNSFIVSERSHDNGKLVVRIIRRNEGEGDFFSNESLSATRPYVASVFPSQRQAEEDADRQLRELGHECSRACSEWATRDE